jgi:hypothetical protein
MNIIKTQTLLHSHLSSNPEVAFICWQASSKKIHIFDLMQKYLEQKATVMSVDSSDRDIKFNLSIILIVTNGTIWTIS